MSNSMTVTGELRPESVNSDSLLTSLAIINVNWEARRDSYLDNFVPFAVGAMQTDTTRSYTEREVKAILLERFGLDLPEKVVASLLGRAVRKKFAKREFRAYVLLDGVGMKVPDIAAQQADCRRKQNRLIGLLVQYAADRFDFVWNADAAETALVGFIQGHSVSLLNLTVRDSSPLEAQEQRGTTYIVTAFIAEVIDRDPEAFAYLDQMVKGSMLASALYLPTPGDVQRKFKNTTLYLDTPVALRALGYEGEEVRNPTQQMMSLAVSQGARLACFAHNVKEIRGVLESAKNAVKRSAGSETAIRGVNAYFIGIKASENDINLLIERIDRDLENLHIRVVDKPDHIHSLTVDEEALDDHLKSHINYFRPGARATDLDSLTAIHRLRSGSSGPYLETCGSVLVTDNLGVVVASRGFFNSGRHEWPIAMLDHDLAALVWVKEPQAAPDLPHRQVMADCYAALAPSPIFWQKIVDEIKRLQERGGITSEDVALLRYSNEAERSIMDSTLGDPSRVSPKAIQEALRKAKDLIAAPVTKQKDEAEMRMALAEKAESEARFEAAQEEIASQELRNEVSRLKGREERHRAQIVKVGTRAASTIGWLLRVLLVAVVLAGTASVVPKVSSWLGEGSSWVLRAAGLAVVVLSAATLICGGSILAWIRSLETSVYAGLMKRSYRKHGYEDLDTEVTTSGS